MVAEDLVQDMTALKIQLEKLESDNIFEFYEDGFSIYEAVVSTVERAVKKAVKHK